MNFKEAYEALKQGAKIKRPPRRAFLTKENDTITMNYKTWRAKYQGKPYFKDSRSMGNQ